jgi:hypothetical protein
MQDDFGYVRLRPFCSRHRPQRCRKRHDRLATTFIQAFFEVSAKTARTACHRSKEFRDESHGLTLWVGHGESEGPPQFRRLIGTSSRALNGSPVTKSSTGVLSPRFGSE